MLMGRKALDIERFSAHQPGASSEEGLDGQGEAARFSFDLLPGAAGDAPASQFELLLALAVGDESTVGVVEAAAVGFDDRLLARQRKSA